MKARVVSENIWDKEQGKYVEIFYAQYKKFLFWHYLLMDFPEELLPPGMEQPWVKVRMTFNTFEEAVQALGSLAKSPKTFKKYYDVYIPKN